MKSTNSRSTEGDTDWPQPEEGPVLLPRVAFLGLGWIGRKRLEALGQSGLAEIMALAEPAPEAIEAAAELAPGAVVARELDELLALEPDGLVLATPSALPAGQAIAALEHGCAVFCQKPLARTAAETEQVLQAARDAGRLLGIDFSYRHTAGMQAIYRRIRDGHLGQIYAVELVFHNAYGPDKAWFYNSALSGGGCLIDLGTHLVDLALWCLDFPAVEGATGRLLANGRLRRRTAHSGGDAPSQVEDYAAAQIYLQSGAVVHLTCSWKAPAGCDAWIEAKFFGTKGGAGFHNVNGSFYDFIAYQFSLDRKRELLAAPPDDWGGRALVEWAGRLASSPGFDPAVEHVRDVAVVLDTLYQANQ
jgi:predicted dehydrogenase